MEKEGLTRALKHLGDKGLEIQVLVTDRHKQIAKWIREAHPAIKHYFDVWHVAKGMKTNLEGNNILLMVVHLPAGLHKKIEALAKQKQCELVAKWQKSVINHLYQCVASTTDGYCDTIKAKWLSLDNHIHNKHTSHGSQLFPKCVHRRLRGHEKKKEMVQKT